MSSGLNSNYNRNHNEHKKCSCFNCLLTRLNFRYYLSESALSAAGNILSLLFQLKLLLFVSYYCLIVNFEYNWSKFKWRAARLSKFYIITIYLTCNEQRFVLIKSNASLIGHVTLNILSKNRYCFIKFRTKYHCLARWPLLSLSSNHKTLTLTQWMKYTHLGFHFKIPLFSASYSFQLEESRPQCASQF